MRVNGLWHYARVSAIPPAADQPVVVLVHGLGLSSQSMVPLGEELQATYRVYAPDLPGFGKSEAPRAHYTFGFLAGGIRAFLDATGIDRCVLVGNSLGGTAAMWLAAAWPERVAGLVLVDAALPLPREARPDPKTIVRMGLASLPGLGEALYSLFVRFKSADWQVADGLRRNVADPTRLSAETLRLMYEEAEERHHRPELRAPLLSAQRNLLWMLSARRAEVERVAASLTVPTLLVWGSDDLLVPLVVGQEWVAKIPGAELLVLEGTGHNPQIEVPDRFAEIVLAFAERLASGAVIGPAGTPGSRG